jgi:hypothetical protein
MDDRHEEMRQQVIEFNREHPEIWRYFCWFTFGLIHKGFASYSVNAIFERIRWEIDAGGNGVTKFKLNNNYRAFYARAFMRKYPEHDGFFRTREQTSRDLAPVKLPELMPSTLSLRYNYEQYQKVTIA